MYYEAGIMKGSRWQEEMVGHGTKDLQDSNSDTY